MNVRKKTIQEFWTQHAPGLDRARKLHPAGTKEFFREIDSYRLTFEPYVEPLIRSFAKKGESVLEIGCGMGTDSRLMARYGCRTVSLDLSYDNVAVTLLGMRQAGLAGGGICADAERLPFHDNSFDAVYSFGVLHHTPGTAEAIRQVHRVLKPGGRAIIMLYHKGYAYYCLLALYGWRRLLLGESSAQMTSRYDHTPLSKIYSKRQARSLFSGFRHTEFSITTFGGIRVHPVLVHAWSILNKSKLLMGSLGSFLIIKATK